MHEMKTLTLNGETFDSFVDQTARQKADEAVRTVNGKNPDENGNIEIKVNAADAAEVAALVARAETAATDAEADAKSARTAATEANNAKGSAMQSASTASAKAILAQTHAGTATEKATAAEESATNASASATRAETAATSADAAATRATEAAERAENASSNSGGNVENGEDGFSPIATVTQTDYGAVISITDKDGTTTATITNGKDGKDGADGQPGKDGADGQPGDKGDKGDPGEKGDKGDPGEKGDKGDPGDKGDTGAPGADGAKGDKGDKGDTGATGAQGEPGKDGANGKDGTSATHSWNGTVLTITSASGTSSADLKGAKGDKGDSIKGDKGDTGAAGTSVTVKSVSESTADGGSNVVTFSDGKTVTIKNGSTGSTGATGKDGKDATVLLSGKKIVYDGDSICESRTGNTANNGGGYAKIIADTVGGTYANKAVSGALLSSHATRHSVVDSLSALPTDGDLYCFEGGYNDYWQNVPIGTCDSADYTGNVDTSTICGALEKIFRYCLSVFVGRPVCFIITHKCQNTAHTANGISKTYKDYHDAMVQVCEKYSVPYYDAFNKSGLNGWNEAQSNAYLTANTSGSGDGVHPNEQGYKRYYVPQLISLFNSMMPTIIVQDATGEEPEQEAVNQIPRSIDENKNSFVGTNGEKGYIVGKRIRSSGTIENATGYNLTGFIPLTQSETLTIAPGVWKTLASSGTYNCFSAYDSSFDFISVFYYGVVGVQDNGDGSITFKPAYQSTLSDIAYARIVGDGVNATAVATKGLTL